MNHQDSIKILLVDADAEEASRMHELLQEKNFIQMELVHVGELHEAIHHVRKAHFDLILLDTMLPDSKGVETFIKIYEQIPDTPIIILSSLSNESIAEEAMSKGAQDYLIKNQLSKKLLRHFLYCVVERHRLRRELERYIQELHNYEREFYNLIITNANGMVVVNLDGIVRFVNPAAESILECKPEEILEKPFIFPFVPGETKEISLPSCAGKTPKNIEMRVSKTEWKGEAAYLASFRDVTDYYQASQILQKSESLTRAILSSLAVHIIVLDENGCIIAINKEKEQTLSSDAFLPLFHLGIGSNYLEFCQKAAMENPKLIDVIYGIQSVMRGSKGQFFIEYSWHLPLGEIWFVMHATPMIGGHGRVVITHENVTDRKHLEESLRESNRHMETAMDELKIVQQKMRQQENIRGFGQIGGGIIQELNNALSPILGLTEILINSPNNLADKNKITRCLQMMNTAAQDAANIVRCLREVYRPRDQKELSSLVDLHKVVEHHTASLRILVMDSDSKMCEILRKYLTSDGYILEICATGCEGLQKFQAGKFDLVIIGRSILEIVGEQLAVTFHRISPATPIILLAGFDYLTKIGLDKFPEANFIVPNPINIHTIREILQKIKPVMDITK